MLPQLPLIVILAAAPLCIRALVLHDRLLAGLYTKHHPLWVQLGRPTGWRWRAPSGGSLFPEVGIALGMLRKNPPDWLTSTPGLRDAYFASRRMARLWNFVATPLLVIAMIVAMLVTVLRR
jgi:hypothetical protein